MLSELKFEMQSKSGEYDSLAVRAAACGRTLAVTEQELRLVQCHTICGKQ